MAKQKRSTAPKKDVGTKKTASKKAASKSAVTKESETQTMGTTSFAALFSAAGGAPSKELHKGLQNLEKASSRVSQLLKADNRAEGLYRPFCEKHKWLDPNCMARDAALLIVIGHQAGCAEASNALPCK